MSNEVTKVEMTTRGLIKAMFEELDALRDGRSTPQRARAQAAIVGQAVSLARLEMDAAKFFADAGVDESGRAVKAITFSA